ncbi:peptide ABC transporter substrate-binding protein [Actinotalea ferrariae CF5-4]|uniref:Peptide ABC transporter substrate-binding protein n=1 Tax=Actinotalea ferrariae CF5-4 TaxID=948458 RepID=A0A021VRI4_9CELL|nr:Fur family transcriptional regulator [Actinotalea ferrariae]EYR63746.1 peptide ABC transporter substrate-binding protein [Actinotalea ferrariae CF5-4]
MQRMTRQRTAVADALSTVEDFRSAQQLHELLRDQGHGIGLATVYRTLQSLAEAGDVDVLRTSDGESVYRRCERREHHHHLMCRSCGTTVEIDGPAVETWAAQIGSRHGFTDIDHTIELFGTCSACARGGTAPAVVATDG